MHKIILGTYLEENMSASRIIFYSMLCSILSFAKDDFKFGESETILCFDYLGRIRK